ncbi:squalene synthase HpnC [Alicyclobacillus cellulosilyticus]|uniref:Squalene synthase HpnC n=1 Tax=Alicyclobacillus cellulosilyticus TaxID=1003997 RepID=A0A917K5L2_9BACL|nr:squalene synthase HpnC [Alicyclobacillus cellulosilyticus]GGI98292.1 squalene synthase HpnC [Alicyclobacillus cellulosilyticus]
MVWAWAVHKEGALLTRLEEAYQYCAQVTRHYENFQVVSRFVPRALRPHFCALYAYCRGVDDLGDEWQGDRLQALAEWERQLRLCFTGQPDALVFVALQDTIRRFDLPEEPFLRLIEANRRDQTVHRYHTWEELRDYCRCSADPVGRLVLALFGYRDEERQRLSDDICTALQLVNFLQDVGRDLEMGRIYLPLSDLAQFGTSVEELLHDYRRGRMNPRLRRCIAFECERAEALFRSGARLERMVPFRLSLQLRLYRLGGQAVLQALRRQGYDPFLRRPTVGPAAKAWLACRALFTIAPRR